MPRGLAELGDERKARIVGVGRCWVVASHQQRITDLGSIVLNAHSTTISLAL